MKPIHSFIALCLSGIAAQGSIVISVNGDIPDVGPSGTPLTSSYSVTGQSGLIGSLTVGLDITGTSIGDLYVSLVHDSGFVVLMNRVGRSATDDTGYADPGLNVTFSDGAPNIHTYRETFADPRLPLSSYLTGIWGADGRNVSPLNVDGSEAPSTFLSSFTGLDPNGSWTLVVADLSGGDSHYLVNWSLDFGNPAVVPEPASGAVLSGVFLSGLLLWKMGQGVIRKGQG